MPPRPRAPRSRVSAIRKPRVAGVAPAGHRADPADSGLLDTRPVDAAPAPIVQVPIVQVPIVQVPTVQVPAGEAPAAEGLIAGDPGVTVSIVKVSTAAATTAATEIEATGPDRATSVAASRVGRFGGRAVPLLAVALVALTALAVFFGIADARLRGTPSARNTALVDVGATAQATGQLTDALQTVYSYDFARLDENERAAREVITPEFGVDFDKLFAQVRELAPQRQAVVSATVQLSAIQKIEGDRAVLVAFMDQRATTAAQGAAAQRLTASGRLTVTGQRVDGRWKIAGVESR